MTGAAITAPSFAGADRLLLDRVSVRYPARPQAALVDTSIRLDAGQTLGVFGRTGAGKSTLALVSAGFIPRVVRASLDGHVRIAGLIVDPASRDVRKEAEKLLGRVGIVFSTPANQLTGSKLSVREELAFGLENLGLARDQMDGRIDAVLDRLGIAHLAEREPYSLSGGEQQRVAIASIVVMGSGLLVLDEPTAQLDPAGRRSVVGLLGDLSHDGTTIVCAESDPGVLACLDQCLVLEQGRTATVERPGVALSTAVLGPLGLRPPTIVRLAEVAGVAIESRFDLEAISRRLSASHAVSAAAADLATDDGAAGLLARAGWLAGPGHRAGKGSSRPVTVAAESLGHRYPAGVEALRDVSLEFAPGSAVAIVGENGSGKTTLAKHLNGLLRPTTGEVRIGGRDISDRPVHELAATVGLVFQDPTAQLFERSVEREVAFGPRSLGRSPAEVADAVENALMLTGLDDVRAANPYDLDMSVRKLVALAGILATRPPVVVLDEPTTGQDGPGVKRVGEIVEALRGAGRTVVAITHDMEFAARHFERVVVMRAGTVVADGSPAEIFAPPRVQLLASTGLERPPAARLGDLLGLGSTPTPADLVRALERARP